MNTNIREIDPTSEATSKDVVAVLERFRAGLREKLFTLRDIERACDIPYTTLVQMRQPDWQQSVFERIANLDAAVQSITSKQKQPEGT